MSTVSARAPSVPAPASVAPASAAASIGAAGRPARASYRALIAVAGAQFLIVSFLGRLPAAMAPLGLILMMADATGGYGRAGLATAALGASAAIGGPVVGALTDRLGQRPVGLIAAILNAAGLAAVAALAASGVGMLAMVALAALVGCSTPQIGPLARVRWAAMLVRRPTRFGLATAMSYEGAADEASYVAGPALVGLLTLTGLPWLPLAVAAALAAGASVAFATHPTATPAAAPGERGTPGTSGESHTPGGRARLPRREMALLVTAMIGLGGVFGATQTGVAAFASSTGHAGGAGLIYAVLGVGSSLAGFLTAYTPIRFGLARRLPVAAGALLAGSLALLLVDSTATAIGAMAALGLTAAPLLITVYGLAERAAPAPRAGAAMTLLASGVLGGVALGAAVAGAMAGPHGYAVALLTPIGAAVLVLLAALAHAASAWRVSARR